MKKAAFLCLILIPLLALSGCTDYVEIEQHLIVSAIGVDGQNGQFVVTAEIVNNTEGALDSVPVTQVLESKGATLEEALSKMLTASSKRLFFSHCSVIILGGGLSREQVADVGDFIIYQKEVTLSIQLVSAKEAGQLIRAKGTVYPIVGYEIAAVLKNSREQLGYNDYAPFYQIYNQSQGAGQAFAIPYLDVIPGEENDTFALGGMAIYQNNRVLTRLTGQQSQFFLMLTNRLQGGELTLTADGKPMQGKIKRTSASVTPSVRDGVLTIDWHLNISMQDSLYDSVEPAKMERAIAGQCQEIVNLAQQVLETDIFHLGDRLYQERPKLFSKFQSSWTSHFVSADIHLSCTVAAGSDDLGDKQW